MKKEMSYIKNKIICFNCKKENDPDKLKSVIEYKSKPFKMKEFLCLHCGKILRGFEKIEYIENEK